MNSYLNVWKDKKENIVQSWYGKTQFTSYELKA